VRGENLKRVGGDRHRHDGDRNGRRYCGGLEVVVRGRHHEQIATNRIVDDDR
jgi:hypothetical protein